MKTGDIGSIFCYQAIYRDVLSTDMIRKHCGKKSCLTCRMRSFWSSVQNTEIQVNMGQDIGLIGVEYEIK